MPPETRVTRTVVEYRKAAKIALACAGGVRALRQRFDPLAVQHAEDHQGRSL